MPVRFCGSPTKQRGPLPLAARRLRSAAVRPDGAGLRSGPRREQGVEVFGFLRYYLRLRWEVLTGRRQTTRPLGVGFRWRQWKYERHLRRVQERDWRQ